MQSLAFHLCVTAVGFVAAGLLASFAQLVSGEPLRFGIEAKSLLASTGAVLLQGLAEPAILMRNAWRGAGAGTLADPARIARPDRRGLELAVGIGPARSDPETLTETGRPKKGAGALREAGSSKARLGRDGWGVITGPKKDIQNDKLLLLMAI